MDLWTDERSNILLLDEDMKLYYWAHQSNFGDCLNPWLWERLIPGALDEKADVLLIGIGTLLNQRIPKARWSLVFGAGVGYGSPPPIDDTWVIYCVRGPLSAQALGISRDFAVTDPALLVNRFINPSSQCKGTHFSFMPHWQHRTSAWQEVCSDLGITYIDPLWPVDHVIAAILQTETLIAEAMHGAIVADALRVPWIPAVTSPIISIFKWRDWCSSMGIQYDPVKLPSLWNPPSQPDRLWGVKTLIKRQFARVQLMNIMRNRAPVLSKETTLAHLTSELEARLDSFKRDVASGEFAGR
jgi:succinoglycan biosynthesis protein ExoV